MKRWSIFILFLTLVGCGSSGGGISSTDSTVAGNFIETTVQLERAFVYALNSGSGSVSAFAAGGGQAEGGEHGHAHERVLAQEDDHGHEDEDEHGHGEGEEEGHAGDLTSLDGSPYFLGGSQIVDAATTPDGRFLYFADRGAAVVRGFAVDGVRGFLQPQSPFTPGLTPDLLAMDEAGTFLLVADAGSNQVAILRIGSAGELSRAATLTLPATPHNVFMHEDLAVFSLSDRLASFSLDRLNGTLTPVSEAALPAGTYRGLVLHEELIFVAEQTSGVLSSFRLEEAELTALSTLALPAGQQGPTALVAPEGRLFVANRDSNNISLLTLEEESGEMTLGETVESQGEAPIDLLLVEGSALVVANSGSNNIATFEVSEEGELEPGEESPYDAGTTPSRLLFLERLESLVVTQPVQN